MQEGKSVFDSDFIYPMYHVSGGDPNFNPKAEEVWKRVVDLFVNEVFEGTGGMPGVDMCFTADERIHNYLKSKGWASRTLSKRNDSFEGGERESLSNSDVISGGKTP
jgi:hypothetical protein